MDILELREKVKHLIDVLELRQLRDAIISLQPADIAELLRDLPPDETAVVFRILPKESATFVFEYLDSEEQKGLVTALGSQRFGRILNEMSADDRTALLEEFPPQAARQLVSLLSGDERQVALKLLGYPENSVGRLMTPDYIAIRPYWLTEQVLHYVREHGRDSDSLNVLYVLDESGKLISEIRIRSLLLAPPTEVVSNLMRPKPVALIVSDDQEVAVRVFKKYDRTMLPVVDQSGIMLGIVTHDDVLDVAEEEATEDIQKLGAVEALEEPYIKIPLSTLVRKRARWLIILFIGEMLTATAMGFFEKEIQQAVVLALFIPLIISSGGNSGSQAATLIIRALAIHEIRLSDWGKVLRRELASGLLLGLILGTIGFLRIVVWSQFWDLYGPHWMGVALVVGISLVGVVMWGALMGAMLPFILKKLGADPATSSAPFVATLVDVTGLLIYFSLAAFFLGGRLL